jgi:pyridoxal phosphate enzyme (YggS family)
MSIAENVARVREHVADACTRAGRSPNDVRLMAVSKTHPASAIREAFAAGVTLFGENRVQEFAAKAPELAGLNTEFHLIGHLQSNKAAKAAELFGAVDSVDSSKLARKLDAEGARLNKVIPVMIEINSGGELSKTGFPHGSHDLDELLESAPRLTHLDICGLMTIPPFAAEPEETRRHFSLLKGLAMWINGRFSVRIRELSMGMSHDYEIAIEEGSTCVRVGTAIFGERQKR